MAVDVDHESERQDWRRAKEAPSGGHLPSLQPITSLEVLHRTPPATRLPFFLFLPSLCHRRPPPTASRDASERCRCHSSFVLAPAASDFFCLCLPVVSTMSIDRRPELYAVLSTLSIMQLPNMKHLVTS